MRSYRMTAMFAALAVMAATAFAQPPADQPGGPGKGDRGPGMMARRGGDDAGPYMKLIAASKLADLTPEQKTKIDTLLQQKKEEMAKGREEMKAAMEKARAATSPEERRSAMEPLRKKHEALQQEIDTNLKEILQPAQLEKLNKDADAMRKQMGDRMRERWGGRPGADDKATSGAAEGHGKHGDKAGKKGKRGEGKHGKKGGDKAPGDSQTSSTAPNPFN